MRRIPPKPRRLAAWLLLAPTGLIMIGCSSSEPSETAVPDAPADCAGEPGTSDDIRLDQWAFASDRLRDDPSAQVWVGFARTMSPSEAGKASEPLSAHGVLLVYEQRQGTYAKVQQRFAAVPVDDATVDQSARKALASVNLDNPLDIPSPDALYPVDDGIGTTVIPIAALLVSGDIGAAIANDECLVYSLSVVEADAPPISPAIEPEAELQYQP